MGVGLFMNDGRNRCRATAETIQSVNLAQLSAAVLAGHMRSHMTSEHPDLSAAHVNLRRPVGRIRLRRARNGPSLTLPHTSERV